MRSLILIGLAAMSLSACGGDTDADANADLNAMTTDNVVLDNGMMANDMGGMDGNVATNADTENMMVNDLTTNDADTNLANGM